jgi:drug/metabolite transporter (DMT)-like permease
MAEIVQIKGSEYQGKIRNPLGVVGLTLITLGIYWLVWYYKLNKELAEIGKAHNSEECGTSPGTSLLAVTLGAFVIVPAFVSMYKTWVRKHNAAALVGADETIEAGLGFLLSIFISPVGHYLLQSDMNKVLQAQAGGGQALPLQGVAAPAPDAAAVETLQTPEQPV